MTLEEFEAKLDEKVAAGIISEEDAEWEYQDFLHRDEVWQEW